MPKCIKTGIDVLIASHNQVVHADMLQIGNCVIIKGFGVPRWADEAKNVDFTVETSDYFGSLDTKYIVAPAAGCVLHSKEVFDQWKKYNILESLTGLKIAEFA